MVCVTAIRGYQLCDGPRRLGCALGSVLARASLLMKEWGSDPDEQPDRWLRLEAAVVSLSVFGAYSFAAYLLAVSLLEG